MKKSNKSKISAAIATAIALGTVAASMPAAAADVEKCYGVVKKGMNDCGNDKHACAGQSTEDSSTDEWMYVIKGTCEKIVGGKP